MSLTRFRAPTGTPRAAWPHDVPAASRRGCVREWPGRYEDEGSERTAHGAVSVAHDGWWSAALSVPMSPTPERDVPVTIRVTRLGPDAERVHAAEVLMQVRLQELDALLVLLTGVVAQARRDGVLPAA